MKTKTFITHNNNITSCILYYENLTFIGTAQCHEDDEDMYSTFTGGTIAEMRACLKLYCHIKQNEIKPQLKSLKQLYYSMNRSKKFNNKSYENIMLQRQIRLKESELNSINEIIADTRQDLSDYIKNKEKVYKMIRDKRQKAEDK